MYHGIFRAEYHGPLGGEGTSERWLALRLDGLLECAWGQRPEDGNAYLAHHAPAAAVAYLQRGDALVGRGFPRKLEFWLPDPAWLAHGPARELVRRRTLEAAPAYVRECVPVVRQGDWGDGYDADIVEVVPDLLSDRHLFGSPYASLITTSARLPWGVDWAYRSRQNTLATMTLCGREWPGRPTPRWRKELFWYLVAALALLAAPFVWADWCLGHWFGKCRCLAFGPGHTVGCRLYQARNRSPRVAVRRSFRSIMWWLAGRWPRRYFGAGDKKVYPLYWNDAPPVSAQTPTQDAPAIPPPVTWRAGCEPRISLHLHVVGPAAGEDGL